MNIYMKIRNKKGNLIFTISIVVLILFNILLYLYMKYNITDSKITEAIFPSKVSDWISEDVVYDQTILDVLAPDRTIYKTYRKDTGESVTLFIAYYNSLEKADLSHSPIVCFTGQGWEILNKKDRIIKLNDKNRSLIRTNQLIQKKTNTILISVYWYQTTHRVFSNRGIQKIYMLYQKLMGRSEHNAFVRTTINVEKMSDMNSKLTNLDIFIQDIYPILDNFIE